MLLRRGLLAAGCLAAVACGSGSGSPAASATPTASPTPSPTLDAHALVQRYLSVLTADLNALPSVKAACAGTVDACATALDAIDAASAKALADLQQLPAEPTSVSKVVEDIRYNLRFLHGWGPNIRAGNNSVDDAVRSCEGDHAYLLRQLDTLRSEAP
jgi:hypothetical protein